MITWKLETRKLSQLKDHPKNPRRLSKDQEFHLRTSLEKFGIVDKIAINTDGTIIGGHQRKRVIKKMGMKSVECYVPDRELNEIEMDELNIRLNKNTGEFDWECLANEWNPEDLIAWGFTCEELFSSSAKELESAADEENKEEEKKKHKCPECGHEFD